MTHRLTTNCAKNYCNRTLIVKVIVENVVTFFWTRCMFQTVGAQHENRRAAMFVDEDCVDRIDA